MLHRIVYCFDNNTRNNTFNLFYNYCVIQKYNLITFMLILLLHYILRNWRIYNLQFACHYLFVICLFYFGVGQLLSKSQ